MSGITILRGTITRAVSAAIALTTASVLTACGGDDDGDNTAAATSGTADCSAVMDKAGSLGCTCIELGDTEEPTTGLTGGLSCSPEAERIGEDPVFTLFGTGTASSGAEVAQKAIDGTAGKEGDNALVESVYANMFRTVDGDSLAGFCIDNEGSCDRVIPEFGLESGVLDGAQSAEENAQSQQDELQRKADEEARESEAAAARAEKEARTYDVWDDLDEAVEQLGVWEIRCMTPNEEDGVRGTTCGADDNPLVWGADADDLDDMGLFASYSRDDMVSVSDGDWLMLCRDDHRDMCDTVADKTGRKVDETV